MEYKNLRVYQSFWQLYLDRTNGTVPDEGYFIDSDIAYRFIRIHDSFELIELTDEEKEKVMCNAELDR